VTAVSVIVPTHDHATTLGLAVGTVLAQTLRDLEVLLVGDGVTDEVRDAARELERSDARVQFLDLPKGPHHGEIHRHTAIEESSGEIIAYHCDDDLMMPEHLADMVALLADRDLAQSLNGYIDPEGTVGLFAGDLEDPFYVQRLCIPELRFNFVGITGTAHTRAAYDRIGAHWETTPEGSFPDQHQWRRMLMGGARGATSRRMTVIGLPTSQGGRDAWTAAERATELTRWAELTRTPDGQAELDRLVGAGAVRQVNRVTRDALQLIDLRQHLTGRLEEAEAALAESEALRADAERRVATITASRWWRLGKRIRPGLSGREA
jgi:hypothetical protein